MSSATADLSKTLQSITITKIAKLEKQRFQYAAHKKAVLDSANEAEHQREVVFRLLSGVEELGIPVSSDLDLSNIHRWLEQSHFDHSIPDSMLVEFEAQLRSQLDMQTRRLDLADLYSRLLREWLNSSNSGPEGGMIVEDDASSLDGSFEVVEKDRLKQLRDKFEAVVFTPRDTDEEEIENYLYTLFEGEGGEEALERLERAIETIGRRSRFDANPFNDQTLIWCLKGLLNNYLLKDDKKSMLKEFLQDEVARAEICDVLNLQYGDIANWSWDTGDEGIPIEPRRQLNGKYRIMMDEDVLQAIFIHYIGMNWSANLKRILGEAIRYTDIWKKNEQPPQEELDRRRYYLGENRSQFKAGSNVESERQRTYREDFFLSLLPSDIWDGAGGYDDDEQQQTWSDSDREEGKSLQNIKQQLLRQLATELIIRQSLDGAAAIVQSDFQWFGTSIPHSTIFAVLRFIGIPDHWITFFRKILEAPLNMGPDSDDLPPSGVRIRRRGVPMAHALEKFFGELVLFFMDLAVNKEAGTLLYRFHDDLWLCGKPDQCAQAWQTMERFSEVMGLDFNMRKTGSVYLTNDQVMKDKEVDAKLPKGPVSVGFLTLDPDSRKWIIDQKEVDRHVTQLQKQLSNCTSILS